MREPNLLSVVRLITDQNDYYKALDIPAQITRLNALNKLLTGNPITSQCDVNLIPKDALLSLIKKSEERLFSSITLLYHLESSISYDELDDFISSLTSGSN